MRLSTFSEPQILELVSFFVLPQACKLLELGEFEIAANKMRLLRMRIGEVRGEPDPTSPNR